MAKLALLSVSDKSGLADFARALVEKHGFRLLSTGGTARLLREAGLDVTDVSDHTGFPEMMEGRVKTLHPKVHGGLLCRRDVPEHLKQAKAHGIDLIDLVVVNLYPFEETIARPGVSREEAIENIDIGGPSMLRSAAKNADAVTVVCDPTDYPRVLDGLTEGGDALKVLNRELARKVYARTSEYDAAIARYLGEIDAEGPDLAALSGFGDSFELSLPIAQKLRYGENPHQQAALYGSFFDHFRQLQGKELSFNNILDVTAAAYLIGEFEPPALAILKHTNPCGVATAESLEAAWEAAFATDREAPFGGIIIVNRTFTPELAEKVRDLFAEVIIAPAFSDAAREVFAKKKNLRLMEALKGPSEAPRDIRSAFGGSLLVQDADWQPVPHEDFQVVTERAPSDDEWQALRFGWKVVKHVKSNAIVLAGPGKTLGIGAGQMSRVDSARLAAWKAGNAKLDLQGSVVASDAFFPFPDALLVAADAGATAAIQPGGSMRDEEVIAAANDRGVAMVTTGQRHFRH